MFDVRNTLENLRVAMKERNDLYLPIKDSAIDRMLYEMCENIPLFTNVVIINGTGGSGKSTLVNICDEISRGLCGNINICVDEFSSIDPIKAAVSSVIGDCVEKDEKYRMLLSKMKTAWIEYDEYGPTRYLKDNIDSKIKLSKSEYTIYYECDTTANIIFVHIREPEEIIKLKRALYESYGSALIITTVLITGRVDPQSHSSDSDRNVDDYEYDITISNSNSRLYLYRYAVLLMEHCINSIFEQAKDDIELSMKKYHKKKEELDALALSYNQNGIV